jgi:hypothetical protein
MKTREKTEKKQINFFPFNFCSKIVIIFFNTLEIDRLFLDLKKINSDLLY